MRGFYRAGVNPLARVVVTPRDVYLATVIGTSGDFRTRQLTPALYDAAGNPVVTGSWIYQSSDTSLVTVSGSGLLTAVGAHTPGFPATVWAIHSSGLVGRCTVYTFASGELTPNEPAGTTRPTWTRTSLNGQMVGHRSFDRRAVTNSSNDSQGWDGVEGNSNDVGGSGLTALGGSSVADDNAPVLIGSTQPNKLLRVRFARGFNPGAAPAISQGNWSLAGQRRMYVRYWIWVSPGWYGDNSNTNKFYNGWCLDITLQHNNYFVSAEGKRFDDLALCQRFQGGNATFQVARLWPGSGDASGYATIGNPTPAGVSPSYSDLLANFADYYYVRRGRWHMIEEELCIEPTHDTQGGTSKLWHNGLLTHNYTGVNFTKATEVVEWSQLRIDPTYGGGANATPVPADQEFRYKWITVGLKAS